ncbi:peroxisome proliferator-activated receptor gamma coactivator-related protein 1 isoform X2 [Varanus komodoensis]|nr:peroxisome proliferator-activated receptor gamma coactivator-related protein 1 isoform X2 [Varanus komodoensis]
MQSYIDSSVISIIEDFSSLTETKGCMDAENELSLLTAITEILDSTDDEFLSPFDTIPDSELLTSPRGCDSSSVEATASLPLAPTPDCPKDSTPSKKSNSKAPRGRRPLWLREQEQPGLQHSDREQKDGDEPATGCRQNFVAGVKEIPAASAAKEAERSYGESNGPCIIAPESISLSELVKSMHPYCQPTITVCLSPESQPLAEELLAGPVVLEIVPDDGESMEIPVVLQNIEVERPCQTESSCTADQVNEEAVPPLEKASPQDSGGLNRDPDLDKQAEGVDWTVLPNAEDDRPQEALKSAGDKQNRPEPGQLAPRNMRSRTSGKGHIHELTKKRRKKSNRGTKRQEKAVNCKQVSACGEDHAQPKPRSPVPDLDFPEMQPEKAGSQGQGELLPDDASQAVESQDTQLDLPLKCEMEMEPKNPDKSSLKSARILPSTQPQGIADTVPTDQADVQREASKGGQPALPGNEKANLEASQVSPCGTMDLVGQPPGSPLCTNNEELSFPTKEAKPRPLSLREYRQRQQQRQSNNGNTRTTAEKQMTSKWPSLPELPKELPELPCLTVPPPLPSTKAAAPGGAKEPEKPASCSTLPAPAAGKAGAMPHSVLPPTAPAVPRPAPPPQPGSGAVAVPAVSPQPSAVGAFPPAGVPVPPTLPPPYLPPAPGSFLPPPSNSYILSSPPPPPVPSWSQFVPVPANYQSLPPPPLAPEARTPVFHAVPPVPPPTWPPPPVPLPPFAASLSYSSVDWAPGLQPPYWSGIPVPPPQLPIPYGNQGAVVPSPSVGTLPAPTIPEGMHGQQSTALTLEPSRFCLQSSQPAPGPQVQSPSAVKTAPRRVSDPRRKAQSLAAQPKAEVTPSSFQLLGKQPSASVTESSEEPPLTGHSNKSSPTQSLWEDRSIPASQQGRDPTGTLKSSKDPLSLPVLQPVVDASALSGPMEKTFTKPTAGQSAKDVSPASQLQEENQCSLPAASVPEKLTVKMETHIKEPAPTVSSSPAASLPPRVHETDQLSDKPQHTWKHKPLISISQCCRNKDIIQAFINEIGIEASDLSSLLEQFEKTEAKKEASGMAKSKENVAARDDCSEAQREKKMVDRLQTPELTNVAGLTPPATPPHQLWKPLAAISLLGKAGSSKASRLLKPLSKPPRKAPAPVHVGSGEHDYCQLGAAQKKGGSQWNVKHSLNIDITPVKTEAKEVPDQHATSQPPAAARVDPIGTLSLATAYQNPKEPSSPVHASQGQAKFSSSVSVSESVTSESPLLESSPRKEPLDHRTSTPKSVTRVSNAPCSVLLTPAASPCRDAEEATLQQPQEAQKCLASKRSLRCYRGRQKSVSPQKGSWKGRRNRASQSFSSSSDGDSDASSSSTSSSSSSSSSRSRSRSHSRSPPSKRRRRYRSRSSGSSSSERSWSRSKGRSPSSSCSSYLSRSSSRSPSYRRSSYRKRRHRYDSSSSRERYQRQKMQYKNRAIEERRVVFIGKIPNKMTRSELRHRFSVFGDIEDCTLHFREHGDNYGFVTYRYAEEAFAAIDGGNALRRPDEQPFDLCFGGRRQFCKRNYVDLDSNQDDFEPVSLKNKYDSLDFDTLLKQAQRSLRR